LGDEQYERHLARGRDEERYLARGRGESISCYRYSRKEERYLAIAEMIYSRYLARGETKREIL
jgi:hypothetical protein